MILIQEFKRNWLKKKLHYKLPKLLERPPMLRSIRKRMITAKSLLKLQPLLRLRRMSRRKLIKKPRS